MEQEAGRVAILIFEEVEVLAFCGPWEVFSVAGKETGQKHFEVFTVAENTAPVRARNGLSVNPEYDLKNCPQAQVLVIPGGWGARAAMENEDILDWL